MIQTYKNPINGQLGLTRPVVLLWVVLGLFSLYVLYRALGFGDSAVEIPVSETGTTVEPVSDDELQGGEEGGEIPDELLPDDASTEDL